MFTNRFATNRAVLRVLLYGWQEHELPEFKFKFKSRREGSFEDVLSKFASDIHLLIVAEDAVADPTKQILRKGLYAEADQCYFVDGKSVKDDFSLNGHTMDDNVKNILVYGFEDTLAPEVVPIFRPASSGTLKDVLRSPTVNYSVAVVVDSRPVSENDDDSGHGAVVEEDGVKRIRFLDEETRAFLGDRALHVKGEGGIHYFILPPSTVRILSE